MSADPRVAVIKQAIAEAKAQGYQWSAFPTVIPAFILTALDAHAAEVQADAREGTVRVRAAVAFGAGGAWCVSGWSGVSDEEIRAQIAADGFNPPAAYGTFYVHPPVPAEIAGEVEAP